MAKLDGLTVDVDVKLGVSDETAEACIALLNLHLKETKRGLTYKEYKDGTVEIHLAGKAVNPMQQKAQHAATQTNILRRMQIANRQLGQKIDHKQDNLLSEMQDL